MCSLNIWKKKGLLPQATIILSLAIHYVASVNMATFPLQNKPHTPVNFIQDVQLKK